MGRPRGEAKGRIGNRLPLELVIRVQEKPEGWLERVLRAALAEADGPAPAARAEAAAALPVMARSAEVVAEMAGRAKPAVRVEVPLAGTFRRGPMQKGGKSR